MSKYQLFGNGINDDYPAIQEMLDSGASEVYLPAPEKHYLISKTLKIHGDQTLRLGKTTLIRLMDGSDCCMLADENFEMYKENICVDGGIWDMNSANQSYNPYHYADRTGKTSYEKLKEIGYDFSESVSLSPVDIYSGMCMRFSRVVNFTMKNVTFRNPVVYAVQVSYMTKFTFRDITFDYFCGSPKLWNLDGIHVEGNCKHGFIQNVKGTTHDDLVALTADDGGPYGPIENIVIDGVYADNTHSAIRLLSHGEPIRNVKISNVFATCYKYAIGLTKYHGGPEERGVYQNISIDNVTVANCEGTLDVHGAQAPIFMQDYIDVNSLSITNVYRKETYSAEPTISIPENSTVNNLVLKNVELYNLSGKGIEHISIKGKVNYLTEENIFVDGNKIK